MRKSVPKGWTISYNPPPIPTRLFDYNFSHIDYDLENDLCGLGVSIADCIRQIEELEQDK